MLAGNLMKNVIHGDLSELPVKRTSGLGKRSAAAETSSKLLVSSGVFRVLPGNRGEGRCILFRYYLNFSHVSFWILGTMSVRTPTIPLQPVQRTANYVDRCLRPFPKFPLDFSGLADTAIKAKANAKIAEKDQPRRKGRRNY
jgi:hypothetical protein